ncbi:MAG: hypothetical protein EBE86_014205 [Hormoscilla sp. GUM202]|nr:hypothetical protein [Hormoscilla sp. GUM202]
MVAQRLGKAGADVRRPDALPLVAQELDVRQSDVQELHVQRLGKAAVDVGRPDVQPLAAEPPDVQQPHVPPLAA